MITLILLLGLSAGASGHAPKTETYQNIIEKAYTLSLQKDRTQAVALLVSAAKKESRKGPTPKELLSSLNEVSTVFYGDKAQQLYELALSLRASDTSLAAQKLNEAARIEPENEQIVLAQIQLQIAGGECDAAWKQTQKTLEMNPFSETMQLANAQAALCSGRAADYPALRTAADPKKTAFETFWQSLDLESAEKAGLYSKGRDLALALSKADPNFPESHYWLWKFGVELKNQDDREAQKYLSACKSMTSRMARTYLAEPHLCKRVSEIETELKKTNNPGRE